MRRPHFHWIDEVFQGAMMVMLFPSLVHTLHYYIVCFKLAYFFFYIEEIICIGIRWDILLYKLLDKCSL